VVYVCARIYVLFTLPACASTRQVTSYSRNMYTIKNTKI